MAEIQENNIPKVYDPKSFETKWYSYWEKRKLFHAEVNDKPAYSAECHRPAPHGPCNGQYSSGYPYPLSSYAGR